MLEFKEEVLQFKYADEVKEIRYPSALEHKRYSDKFNKDKATECMIDFVVDLGLDRVTAEKLQIKHLITIFKELTQEKKQ